MKASTRRIRRRRPASVQVPEGTVRVLESHHAKDFRMELGDWPFHKICWVSVGRGFVQVSGNKVPIQPGDILVLPSGCLHRFVDVPNEPLTLVILCLSLRAIGEDTTGRCTDLWNRVLAKWEPGTPLGTRTSFHEHEWNDLFRLALREQDHRLPGWEIILRNTGIEVLTRLVRGDCIPRSQTRRTSEQAIEGVLEYLAGHFHEPLRIEEIAEKAGLSPRRFTELFKKRAKMTFSHYLNELRIQFACERLEESGHILYACHESGFNDLAYFYRVFKKHTGMTPGEFMDKPKADKRSL